MYSRVEVFLENHINKDSIGIACFQATASDGHVLIVVSPEFICSLMGMDELGTAMGVERAKQHGAVPLLR